MNEQSAKLQHLPDLSYDSQKHIPVTGRLEKVVHLADNMVPSTSLAVQIHEELKKSGLLSKKKNTMIYLMSAKQNANLPPVNKMTTNSNSVLRLLPQNGVHTLDKKCAEQQQQQQQIKSHVSAADTVPSQCTVQPQSRLNVSEKSSKGTLSNIPVVTKQGSAVSQIGTLTLPIVAPEGVTLSKSSEYIPVLCQIGGKKQVGQKNSKKLPVYLLEYPTGKKLRNEKHSSSAVVVPPAEQQVPTRSQTCSVKPTEKPISDKTIGKKLSNENIPSSAVLVPPAEQPVATYTQSCSAKPAEKSIQDKTTVVSAEHVANDNVNSGSWKIINGNLMKGNRRSEVPLTYGTSRAVVRLPIGTGQAPSLITGDGRVHTIMAADENCDGKQVMTSMISKLNQSVNKKESLSEGEPVLEKMRTTSAVSPNESDKNVIETTISSNPQMFIDISQHHQWQVEYAYETEGLDNAPKLLICNLDEPLLYAGSSCLIGSSDEEDEISGNKPGHIELDTCCVSGSLLTVKDNLQLKLNSCDAGQCLGKIKDSQEAVSDRDLGGDNEPVILEKKGGKGIQAVGKKQSGNCCEELGVSELCSGRDFQEACWNVHDDPSDLITDDVHFGSEPKVDVLDGVVFVDGVEIEIPAPRESVTGYCCYICGYAALSKDKVIKHWFDTHAPDKPYVCGVCRSAAFSSMSLLTLHIKQFHTSFASCMPVTLKPSRVFKNELVMIIGKEENIANSCLEALLNDVEAKPDNDADEADFTDDSVPIFCNSCSFSTFSVMAMRKHLKRLHPKPFCFNCSDCHKLFSCRFDLGMHRRVVHGAQDDNGSGECSRSVFQHKVTVRLNGAYLNWDKLCKSKYTGGSVAQLECLVCRNTGLETVLTTARSMWLHLEYMHKWPSHLFCSKCASKVQILDVERRNKKAHCHNCSQVISLQPIIEEESHLDLPVYICKACNYKTMERSSIFRHVKYSYAQFRPYSCPYCKYSSSEKGKVKHHVMNSHTDKRRMMRVNMDSIHKMKEKIDALMEKMTMKVKYRDLDALLGEDESMYSCEWNQKYLSQNCIRERVKNQCAPAADSVQVNNKKSMYGQYQCKDCSFVGGSLLIYSRHRRRAHGDLNAPVYVSSTRQSKFLRSSRIAGQHYQCSICHYCCLDRSSMTRHIKYMHMHERPHACPYCSYKNVEKTKVRIHVISTHSGSPVYVKTDLKLLKAISLKVKGNYKRVFSQQDKSYEVPKRKPGRPPATDTLRKILEQVTVDKQHASPECPDKDRQFLSSSGGSAQCTSKMDNDIRPITIKTEPGSDVRGVFGEIDYSVNDPEPTGVNSEWVGMVKPKLEEINVKEEKPNSPLTDTLSEKDDCTLNEQDEDGQVVDVAWMVETIDADSDEEVASDDDEEPDTEEADMCLDDRALPCVGSRKRKSLEEGGEKQKSKVRKTVYDDVKLRMKPVVVLRDVIQQILCSELG